MSHSLTLQRILGAKFRALGAVAAVVLFLTGCTGTAAKQTQRPETIASCASLHSFSNRTECITTQALRIAHSRSTTFALRKVEYAAARSEDIAIVCHQAMHRFAARVEAQRTFKSAEFDRFSKLKGACASGFIHGIFERTVEGGTTAGIAAAVGVCDALLAERTEDHLTARECYHGLGHGLRRRAPNDARALDACDRSLKFRPARIKCYGGAFMESQFRRANPNIPVGSQASACAQSLSNDRALVCWAFAVTFRGELAPAQQWCESAPTPAAQQLCFASYGRSLPITSIAQCAEFGYGLAATSCLRGFLRGDIYEARLLTISSAHEMCDKVPAPYDTTCRDVLAEIFRAGSSAPTVDSMNPRVV